MSYLVLARKYRPQSFEEVVCQSHVTQTLTNAIGMGRVPHAVLFSGPRGTGKTTVARILAKAINCIEGPTKNPCNTCRSCLEITRGNAVDVFEIDGASNNSVDQIRELRENIRYMPAHSRRKVYIIDEVHMLSTAAFNALLKTLEEPPAHIMFIFATTEPHKIPLTILSRCQRHDFKRVDIESISKHLRMVCTKEGFEIDDDSLSVISREAGGSVRDALSLLDQVAACSEGRLTLAQLAEMLGIIDGNVLLAISKAVFQGDIPGILDILDEIYDQGQDIKKLYADILGHFRNMLVLKMGKSAEKSAGLPKHEVERIYDQIDSVPLTYLNQILDFLFHSEPSIRYSENPKLALEMVFFRLLQIKPALPIDFLLKKIDEVRKSLIDAENQTPQTQKGVEPAGPKPFDSYVPDDPASFSDESHGVSDKNEDMTVKEDIAPPVGNLSAIWERLLDALKKDHPAIAANLMNSDLQTLDDEKIVIQVNGSDFNQNMIKKEKNRLILQNMCNVFFKKNLNLVIDSKKADRRVEDMNSAEKKQKQSALNHPLVADAVNIFCGKIVDVSVL